MPRAWDLTARPACAGDGVANVNVPAIHVAQDIQVDRLHERGGHHRQSAEDVAQLAICVELNVNSDTA